MFGEPISVPEYWTQFWNWMAEHRIGDVAGVTGVLISIVGFAVTMMGVLKSKRAAQRAEEASRQTRESIRLLDTVVDFSSAISILEEIKRAHRQEQWALLPDRYSAIRKLLISLRATSSELSEVQQTVIQSALKNLYDIERAVERGLANPSTLKPARFNTILSQDIDGLLAVLSELKAAKSGG